MPKPTDEQVHAIAKRFKVTTRTVRNWRARGYPLHDEAALTDILIGQHSRASGVDAVHRENRSKGWWNIMSEETRDAMATLLTALECVLDDLRGGQGNYPAVFAGNGPDLTEAEWQTLEQWGVRRFAEDLATAARGD